MKLYRIVGRREVFKQCGKLLRVPEYFIDKASANKRFTGRVKDWKERKLSFDITLQLVEVATPTQADMLRILTDGDAAFLVKVKKELRNLEWHTDEEAEPVF